MGLELELARHFLITDEIEKTRCNHYSVKAQCCQGCPYKEVEGVERAACNRYQARVSASLYLSGDPETIGSSYVNQG